MPIDAEPVLPQRRDNREEGGVMLSVVRPRCYRAFSVSTVVEKSR